MFFYDTVCLWCQVAEERMNSETCMDITWLKDVSTFTVQVSNTEMLNQHKFTEVTFDMCNLILINSGGRSIQILYLHKSTRNTP